MSRSHRAGRRTARLPLTYVLAVGLFAATFSAAPAQAQFRNNGIQLPVVGWTGMGTSTDWLFNGVLGQVPWAVTDQVNFGVGYFRAVGYNLWLDNQVVLGVGTGVSLGTISAPVFSLMVSTGLPGASGRPGAEQNASSSM